MKKAEYKLTYNGYNCARNRFNKMPEDTVKRHIRTLAGGGAMGSNFLFSNF